MQYMMKSGNLYKDKDMTILAKTKSVLVGPIKKIYNSAGNLILEVNIRYLDEAKAHTGDVRNREYTLTDYKGNLIASAFPEYADGDDPNVVGWPICRMPKVDHANINVSGNEYTLTMNNSKKYTMKNRNNVVVLSILHNGIMGGWLLEDSHGFAPEILCGIFTFCRYMEQENELLVI